MQVFLCVSACVPDSYVCVRACVRACVPDSCALKTYVQNFMYTQLHTRGANVWYCIVNMLSTDGSCRLTFCCRHN